MIMARTDAFFGDAQTAASIILADRWCIESYVELKKAIGQTY